MSLRGGRSSRRSNLLVRPYNELQGITLPSGLGTADEHCLLDQRGLVEGASTAEQKYAVPPLPCGHDVSAKLYYLKLLFGKRTRSGSAFNFSSSLRTMRVFTRPDSFGWTI